MTKKKIKAFIDAIVSIRNDITDEQALAAPSLYPEWKVDTEYRSGERLLFNDVLYKVITPHKSQADWTPDVAVSLFAKVLVEDPNQIYDWEQPESTNPYMKNAKVRHKGKIWISNVDNNTWEPGVIGTETVWIEYTE